MCDCQFHVAQLALMLNVDTESNKRPTLKHVIPSDGREVIVGLTFIKNELYVLRQPSKKGIQVYETATIKPQRTVRVAGLVR